MFGCPKRPVLKQGIQIQFRLRLEESQRADFESREGVKAIADRKGVQIEDRKNKSAVSEIARRIGEEFGDIIRARSHLRIDWRSSRPGAISLTRLDGSLIPNWGWC